MTRFYFEKLGSTFTGSVVPLCAPGNPNAPGPRVLNYPSALQDLQYVLGLIGEDAAGNFHFLLLCLSLLYTYDFSLLKKVTLNTL